MSGEEYQIDPDLRRSSLMMEFFQLAIFQENLPCMAGATCPGSRRKERPVCRC